MQQGRKVEEEEEEEEVEHSDDEDLGEEDGEDDDNEEDEAPEWVTKKPLAVILELPAQQSQSLANEGAGFLCPECKHRCNKANKLARHLANKHYFPNTSMMVLTDIIMTHECKQRCNKAYK
jgi:hypothetical protein